MKRLFDLVLSSLALLVLSPIFLVVALGIMSFDPGPVLYVTARAGRNGDAFNMLKFRSMRVTKNSENSRITASRDSRIFAFGMLIRLLKLDELPQLINILKGDMSIIGPRPEDLSIVQSNYTKLLRESLECKPGLASPGSIFYYTHLEKKLEGDNIEDKYLDEILYLKVKMDVVYKRNINIFYDFKLVSRTVGVIVAKVFGKKNFRYPWEYYEAIKM